jgi:hypothetical protein
MQPIAARQWSSGFLPGKYQGSQAEQQWRPCFVYPESKGDHGRGAEERNRSGECAEPLAIRRVTRPGNPNPDRPIRTGFRDAIERSGSGGCFEGTKERAGCLRGHAGRRQFCLQLPSGEEVSGARRALYSALPSRLGSSRGNSAEHAAQGGTWSSVACWMTLWWFGAANSGVHRCPKAATAGITTSKGSASC